MERGSVIDNQEVVQEYCTTGDFYWSTKVNGKVYWAPSLLGAFRIRYMLDSKSGVHVDRPRNTFTT